jgi:apolipoprotein N-acyltransferase
LMVLYGNVILKNAKVSEDTADIVLAQPNIKQKDKWVDNLFDAHIQETKNSIATLSADSVDLIVFPETAIPAYLKNVPDVVSEFKRLAINLHSDILIGSLDYERRNDNSHRKYHVYNSGFLFSKDSGKALLKYDKNRLVPFSERLPWEDIFPFISYLDFGEGDFTSGTESPVWGKIAFSPQICYEVVYPYFIRNAIANGARIVVVITNDGWFGRSTQPYQHANLIRYRAVENGIPIVQSANTGVSVAYDSYGRELVKTEIFTKTAVRQKVPLKNRVTFYSRFGGYIENLIFGIFLIYTGFFIYSGCRRIFVRW